MTEDATTRPTIETVLERIDALDQKLEGRIDGLGARMDGVEHQVNSMRSEAVNLRSDMNAGLKQVGRKIATLNDNVLTIQSDFRDFNARLENIESQGS
jgi:chromosome segregation ATPase